MQIQHHKTLPSTQSHAESLWKAGHKTPILIHADTQTDGKGTQNRLWTSESGGLYTSALIPWPTDKTPLSHCLSQPGFLPSLHLEIGLLLKVLIQDFAPSLNPIIKWPNDLNIHNKKCAGILMQSLVSATSPNITSISSATETLQHTQALIIGIGLNVNQTQFPAELPEATSLRLETQECYNTTHIAKHLAQRIEAKFYT